MKVCQWVLRNSNWDAVSLSFEGYEGLRVFHVLKIIILLRVIRVMRVHEDVEGKYLTSSCIYYWFRTFNGWRTLNTTDTSNQGYTHNLFETAKHLVILFIRKAKCRALSIAPSIRNTANLLQIYTLKAL